MFKNTCFLFPLFFFVYDQIFRCDLRLFLETGNTVFFRTGLSFFPSIFFLCKLSLLFHAQLGRFVHNGIHLRDLCLSLSSGTIIFYMFLYFLLFWYEPKRVLKNIMRNDAQQYFEACFRTHCTLDRCKHVCTTGYNFP